jgi:hypothetical protein
MAQKGPECHVGALCMLVVLLQHAAVQILLDTAGQLVVAEAEPK